MYFLRSVLATRLEPSIYIGPVLHKLSVDAK